MRKLGLIGGMSWESTAIYYQGINRSIKQRLGGFHSAAITIDSLDFAVIEELQRAGDWAQMGRILAQSAQSLERADVDFVALATNTMHQVADDIRHAIELPFLHILEPTVAALRADKISQVAVLGTAYTMQAQFYRDYLNNAEIEVLYPSPSQQQYVHDIIFTELVQGTLTASAKQQYLAVIDSLQQRGAQGVILGCTEIGLLIQQQDSPVAIYDTTQLHIEALVDTMLQSTSSGETL